MTARRWWMLALLYMAGLFALSSVPDDPGKPGIGTYFPRPSIQNALHVPAYALLSYLMWRGLRGPKGRAATFAGRNAAVLAAVLATAYGVTDEVHQMFVVGRTASVTDALANAVGAFAVAAWALLRARRAPGPPTLP
ncbi:MAG: VanZ family protein [Planctomycetes bacterium]|nr:VanZ family protein [Planctomycetota bacterium]